MIANRIIPCLLISNRRLVKTTRFKNPQYVGDPLNAVRIFNDKEVDEIILLDVDASRSGRGPDFEYIEELASECFIPLTYGGGVASLDDAHLLFRLGIEKICLKTAAVANSLLVSQLISRFGSSSVVLCVDVAKSRLGRVEVVDNALRKVKSAHWPSILDEFETLGAGEILLQAVDRDGTLAGPDLDLLKDLGNRRVPIIAAGGVRSLRDIRQMIDAGADAVAAGAFFVFHGPHRAVLISYPSYAEISDVMGTN